MLKHDEISIIEYRPLKEGEIILEDDICKCYGSFDYQKNQGGQGQSYRFDRHFVTFRKKETKDASDDEIKSFICYLRSQYALDKDSAIKIEEKYRDICACLFKKKLVSFVEFNDDLHVYLVE